ncbi:MAG: T9SS type A sorting domain-containing protein [Calditrichia bacterium]
MKYSVTTAALLVLLFMLAFGYAAEQNGSAKALQSQPVSVLSDGVQDVQLAPVNPIEGLRNDTLVYLENFESGAPGWVSIDETNPGEFFHQDDWMAYGGSGLSWWLADTTLGNDGGYLSHWYQVLDSPEITVNGNATLSFVHRLKVEDPAGATAPYDGWDGVNVRISTDSGATWTVLQNPNPAYNTTSLYSFGEEWGEGPNVPGWGGAITTWTPVTVDLSGYTGDVMIRFAFASDPAFDTNDDPTMFGWQVDEIKVEEGGSTLYYNDGTQNDMIAKNWGPVGGDYWHISTDPTAPSPTHIGNANDPAINSYHPNMQASYISPYFWLPDTITEAYLDFALQGTYTDPDVFPAVDYFGAYVQVKGETTWRYISNITMDPNGDNFVYSSAPDFWSLFSASYSTGLVDLSPLLGDSIRVKFTFFSDEDAPQGTAVMIDDVIVWTPPLNLPAPANLEAAAGDNYVDLLWDEMNQVGHQQFVYDDGTFENAIHLNSGTADAGVYFNSGSAATIDTVWIWGYSSNTTNNATLKIWEANAGSINTNPTYTKPITLALNQWNAIDLTGDNWTVAGDFVAGIQINLDMWIPLDETTIPSSHSYVNLGGWSTWQSVAAAQSPPLPDGEWGIRAAVSYSGGTNITYNVYRKLDTAPNYGAALATGLNYALYHDATANNGETYCYVVTAVYPGQGESGFSNEVCVTPQAATIYEMKYDDGTAESYYGVGSGNYVAVKYDLNAWPQDLVTIRAYFQNNPGSAQFIVWDDDGTNGMPGTVMATQTVANLQGGWNDVPMSGVSISNGSFYAGVRFAPTTPDVGIDETAPIDDMSYLKIGTGVWEKFTGLGLNYDVMVRVELDSASVGIEDLNPAMIENFELLQNYPNPFNPSTQIAFTVPQNFAGKKAVLKVYDLLGREVATLLNGPVTPGVHRLQWNGTNNMGQAVTSGIYFYTIKTGDLVQTRKMILMR